MVEKYWESQSADSEGGCIFSNIPMPFSGQPVPVQVLIAQNLSLLLGIYCFLEFIATICFSQFLELPVGTEVQLKVHGWKTIASHNIKKMKLDSTSYHMEMNSEYLKDLNVKHKTTKLLEDNVQ